ncbi:hypothetical protein V1291_000288 [Nitrobacteraceae bacterium AZCC 1564]
MNDTQADAASATAASEPLTGRAAEWAAAGFKEMPETETSQDNDETGSDVASLREAGRRIAQPSHEPVTRAYLDAEGKPAAPNEAITLERAARDYTNAVKADNLISEARTSDVVAAEVDAARYVALSANANNAQVYGIDLPELTERVESALAQQGEMSPGASQVDAQDTDKARETPADGELDPELEKALRHPQVRQAIEQQLGEAEHTRRSYADAIGATMDVAKVAFFNQFPELAGLTEAQIPMALQYLSQTAPEKFARIRSTLTQLEQLGAAQQHEKQLQAMQARESFKAYAKAEDARFDALVAGQSKQSLREAAAEIVAAAAEYGIDRGQLMHLFESEPIMRNAAFQKMMHDAAKYRLAQKAVPKAVPKTVPHVQKPGVSRPAEPRGSEDVRALAAKFASNPSVKNAAALYAAKQRMNER